MNHRVARGTADPLLFFGGFGRTTPESGDEYVADKSSPSPSK